MFLPQKGLLQEAVGVLFFFGFVPFFSYYIFCKEHAARSIAPGRICFGPIGIMFALRRSNDRSPVWISALVALLFSLGVEFGRWFKPSLQPDFSNAIVAAVGAGLAAKLSSVVWRVLEGRPIVVMGA